MPMTSPVDFISGPSTVSTPAPKRANGNTASFTPMWRAAANSKLCGFSLKLASVSPAMMRAAILADRHAGHLGDERHRARGARIDLEHVDVAVLDGVLHVHQAADLERQRQRAGLPVELGDRSSAERLCGGSEQAESPEWMPASSMCSMMPAM